MNTPARLRSCLRYGYPWATLGLGPFLLAQGAYVRRTVERLPEPEGPRAGVAGQGKALKLLVLGDSAAAGVGVEHQHDALSGRLVSALGSSFRVHWQLVAQSGYTTSDIFARLQATPAAPFDSAVISIGVNDATGSTGAGKWIAGQRELHALLASRFQVRHLLCSSVPPLHLFPALPQPLRWYLGSRARHFNHTLADYLHDQAHCDLIDIDLNGPASTMARDGFHPGPAIYAQWAQQLAQAIRARWLPADAAAAMT